MMFHKPSLRRTSARIARMLAGWHPTRSRITAACDLRVTWKQDQRTVWIATSPGEFLGLVEEVNGRFVANDTARGTYRTYATLSAAKNAFEAIASDAAPRQVA